jgi:rsbT co-antagonist protein RsbR
VNEYAGDPKKASSALCGMTRVVDVALGIIGEAYLATKEEVINQQLVAIRELSTPVLQVQEGILIVPLIGVIDTHRARQLTEDLLRAVRARRARVVVVDITGVAVVDSKVANHIVQTIASAELMGVITILTGISPDIAQTLVTIGAELRHVRTLGDLQSGITEARRMLGYRLVKRDDDKADLS